jgi:hypothetical protein
LRHFYRAIACLGEALPKAQQDEPRLSRRANKGLIEEEPFARRRALFSDLDIVFFDPWPPAPRRGASGCLSGMDIRFPPIVDEVSETVWRS